MNLTDLFSLKIRTEDFNTVIAKPELLKKLRNLTLHPGSGLNYEINNLIKSSKTRSVNAKALLAYHKRELVGWALMSREKSDFYFQNTYDGYEPSKGTLFEVYVHPDFRRRGIGASLMKAARKKAGAMRLCVCPWDYQSTRFYQNFDHYKNVKM